MPSACSKSKCVKAMKRETGTSAPEGDHGQRIVGGDSAVEVLRAVVERPPLELARDADRVARPEHAVRPDLRAFGGGGVCMRGACDGAIKYSANLQAPRISRPRARACTSTTAGACSWARMRRSRRS